MDGSRSDEIVLALRVERRLEKREILALYLSLAPYGHQYVGARAASQGYFGVPVANLTPAQAAFLAGLPQRPTALSPRRRIEMTRARQARILERMAACGFLSGIALERARAERLQIARPSMNMLAPHFVGHVLATSPTGLRRIETTLDADLQREVRGILEMHRARLREHGAANVAVAVLDNESAEWLAWEDQQGARGRKSSGDPG